MRVADVLRGVEAVPEELHPPIHRDEFIFPLQPLEPVPQGVHLSLDKSVLRLFSHGYNIAQLRLPCYD